jgi:peptidyl-prolyl cis-trans isomerase SurA
MHVVRPVAFAARVFANAALIVLIGIAAAVLAAPSTSAQQIAAFVNGEPITALDVAQRARVTQLIGRRTPTKQESLEELVNEKIMLQQAIRLRIIITDDEVERAYMGIVQRSGRKAAEFASLFDQAKIDLRAFKAKLRADLVVRQVLQQQYPGAFQVRDADIIAMLSARGQQATMNATQYTLRQFIFVMPRGSSLAVRAARTKEAEALRARFTGCEEGTQIAREFREVVIMEPVVRISTDLPERLQQLLESTSNGQLTPPEPTASGIEVVAICDRKSITVGVTARREIREQLMAKRVKAQEKQLLDRLRQQSIIEYR